MSLDWIDTESVAPETAPSPAIDIHVSDYLLQPRLWERVFGLFLFAIALPVIVGLSLLVRITSRGPGLYRQTRAGRNGRIFVMLKIRTMADDAEAASGPQWTRVNDPRITRIGWLLRKTHLDELPQLWNVARGDMALMGPRPERPELISILADRVPGYLNRLAVQPGITGLAQINLPPDTDLQSVRQKLHLDLEYIRTATPGLDARMFVWTVLRLFGCPASLATRWMGLGRKLPAALRTRPADVDAQPLTIDAILATAPVTSPDPASGEGEPDFPGLWQQGVRA